MVSGVQLEGDPAGDFRKACNALADATGRTKTQAVAYAMRRFCESARAATKPGKKLRPIVRNPDIRAGHDRRIAPFGVMKLYQNKDPKFVPIFRGGEFGASIYYRSKKTADIIVKRSNKKGQSVWMTVDTGVSEIEGVPMVPGIEQSPKRNIKRRGLCKRAWNIMAARVLSLGNGGHEEDKLFSLSVTPHIARVTHGLRTGTDVQATGHNRLPYATQAGRGDVVVTAMRQAAKALNREIEKGIARATKKAFAQ
jgi:hypothetical protein